MGARRSEPDLSLSDAERIRGGLHISVRLRVAIELLRSLAEDSQAPTVPRATSSRLFFERVAVSSGDAVCATGPGDTSGAALVLWEICAGRPLDVETPLRLHDIVDDMPADVDDLVTGALSTGAHPTTTAELLDELTRVGESYAVAPHGLWERLSGGAPSSRTNGGLLDGASVPAPSPKPQFPAEALHDEASVPAPGPQSPAEGLPEGASVPAPVPQSPVPAEPPPAPAKAAVPSSRKAVRSPSDSPPAPAATRSRRTAPPAAKRATPPAPNGVTPLPPTKTSATLPSMKAVEPLPVHDNGSAKPLAHSGGSAPRPLVRDGGSTPRPPGSDRRSAPNPPASGVSARAASPALLLLHAGEEAGSLADALRAAGYLVVVHGDAESGLAHAIAENPVCILCDSDLPDADGEAVVRRIRQQPSAVAAVPFVLLVADGDTHQRVARFEAGVDVCMLKPITLAALIQQVDALVDMASRLRAAHHALPAPPRVAQAAALTGDIRQVGIAAVLTILEMERRTGSFVATSEGKRVPSGRGTIAEINPSDRLELDLARGCVAGASAMGVPARPIEVVRAMLRLAVGWFAFRPTKTRYVEAPSISELLSEAARLEDEVAAGRS